VKGFSLLELIIAVSILLIVMGTISPAVVDYYSNYRMVSAQQDLVSVLRKAQALAMSNQYEEQYGVYIASSSFVVFRGSSYASRTSAFDDPVSYSAAITITGPTEIIFAQLSGRASATGTLMLSSGAYTRSAALNNEGRVEW